MNPAAQPHASLPWGDGDIYTLVIAVIIFCVGCLFHRRAIIAQGAASGEVVGGLMGSALSVGPMLMIVAYPLNKSIHMFGIDLLRTVMDESRITLWFAAFLALVNTTLAFLRGR